MSPVGRELAVVAKSQEGIGEIRACLFVDDRRFELTCVRLQINLGLSTWRSLFVGLRLSGLTGKPDTSSSSHLHRADFWRSDI